VFRPREAGEWRVQNATLPGNWLEYEPLEAGDADKGVKIVTLMLQNCDAFQAAKSVQVKSIVVTPVTGVGDDAYYLAVGNNAGLIVKKGNVVFKVAIYGGIGMEKKQALEKALAQQVLSSL
jgi:hypothetical protein